MITSINKIWVKRNPRLTLLRYATIDEEVKEERVKKYGGNKLVAGMNKSYDTNSIKWPTVPGRLDQGIDVEFCCSVDLPAEKH
jgi:hypothetical protein